MNTTSLALAAVLLGAVPAAAITYDVDTGDLGGSGISLLGTITTDGTTGTGLSAGIITGFDFVVTVPTGTLSFSTAAGGRIDVSSGAPLVATVTSLSVDFGLGPAEIEFEQQTGTFFTPPNDGVIDVFEFCVDVDCIGDGLGAPARGVGYQSFDDFFNLTRNSFESAADLGAGTSPLLLGTVDGGPIAPVPLPAGLPLLLSGLLALGLALRRRR